MDGCKLSGIAPEPVLYFFPDAAGTFVSTPPT